MKKLQSIIFKWNYLFTLLTFTIAMFGALIYYANISLRAAGESRVNLLMQVAQRSKVINKAAITLSNIIYLNSASQLLENTEVENEALTNHINQLVAGSNYYFDGMDIDLSALIIMRNNYQYISGNELTTNTEEIRNNYWYLDNYSNNKNEFWIMRFGDTMYRTNCMLSYGKVIRNSRGEYCGIILVNAAERTFFQVYSDLIDEGNNVYILDEYGYAVSHSVKDLIGAQVYYMPAFFNNYGRNSYKLDISKQLLVTSYQDPTTNWTLVQESSLRSVFGEYYAVVTVLVLILIVFLMVGAFISYMISKYISRPLHLFADKMHNVSDAKFERLELQGAYEEIYKISIVYNEMVEKIEQLIEKIKDDERMKRKSELDFLQLQINPHFLRNTLFSIKCLIELGKTQEAAIMTMNFMHMLNHPIAAENEFISLYYEADMLKDYVSLMSYRYNNIRLEVNIDEEAGQCQVPRLLLQPIVENAIFHGLDEESDNFTIDMFAYVLGDGLTIKIRDNGMGMTQEELEKIWSKRRIAGSVYHNIGLNNIFNRIKAIYGEDCGMHIASNKGEGTEVELRLKTSTGSFSDVEHTDR